MSTTHIRMKDIIKNEVGSSSDESAKLTEFMDDAVPSVGSDGDITVDFINVEPITIQSISDTYGRISDAVEAAMNTTGLAVIPLDMLHIAPGLLNLKRHEIYDFNGKRYAMATKPREKAIKEYQDKIIENLSTGVPFKETLGVTVQYDGDDFFSLALSRCEWTVILSMFRNYKQRLYDNGNGDIMLEVYAESAQV